MGNSRSVASSTKNGRDFKSLEREGWGRNAVAYNKYMGEITAQIMEDLLDAASVRAGSHVLDVACGTGNGSAVAAKRGARPIGVDFAPTMVAEAHRRNSELDFRIGDAENLDLEATRTRMTANTRSTACERRGSTCEQFRNAHGAANVRVGST